MKTHPDPRIKEFIIKACLLQLMEGSFSGPGLAREAGKSYGYTSSTLSRMLSRGLVRRVRGKAMLGSGGKSLLMGFSPARYVLTARGRSLIRVVLAGGVFDLLHPGHLSMLTVSKRLGDVLIVVVARDSTAMRRKGMPFLGEADRLLMLSSLKPVDAAILGSEKSFSKTLERVRPDVVSLGYDQARELSYVRAFIRRTGRRIEVSVQAPLPGYSTRKILSRGRQQKAA